VPLQCAENLADRPIDLHDDVTIKPARGFAFELVAHVQRDVRHVVRDVEKERTILVVLDELDRALRVPGCEMRLVFGGHVRVGDLLAFDQRQRRVSAGFGGGMVWPHIVRVRQSEVIVEAVARRQELRMMAQVPFAVNRGRVTAPLQHLGEREFVRVNSNLRCRPQRAKNSDAIRIASGQQRRARGGTYRLRDTETREPHSFGGHAIEIRRLNSLRAIDTDVGIAHVVSVDEDEVWGCLWRRGDGKRREQKPGEKADSVGEILHKAMVAPLHDLNGG